MTNLSAARWFFRAALYSRLALRYVGEGDVGAWRQWRRLAQACLKNAAACAHFLKLRAKGGDQ